MTSSRGRLVEVAPSVPLRAAAPQTFTYRVSAADVVPPHSVVVIPFGRRQIRGVVMATTARRRRAVKPIVHATALQLTPAQVALAAWIARGVQGGLGYTLRLFYPPPGTDASPRVPSPVTERVGSGEAIIEWNDTRRAAELAAVLAAQCAGSGQAVVFVPEQWMALPLQERLQVRPDLPDCVVFHAALPVPAQRRVWERVARGEKVVVVGTQKALYLPYRQLRVVAVEAESLPAHKQWGQYPRLHTVRAAAALAAIHGAAEVYATRFPSLRLTHAVAAGTLQLRAHHPRSSTLRVYAPTPADRAARHLLPDEFVSTLRQWLTRGQRVAILHNVRGTWRTIVCRTCHLALRCPQCQTAFAVAGSGAAAQLVCRHCDIREPVPAHCPQCRTGRLTPFGAGLDRFVVALRDVVPKKYPLVTVTAATATARSIDQAPLVVGTSVMFRLLAGHRIDRAAWLSPEYSLLYPDFRSEEISFITLSRLQGLLPPRRAVVAVTRQPRLLETTLALPEAAWRQRQLRERKRLGYPPYTDSVRLTIARTTAAQADSAAAALKHQLLERAAAQGVAERVAVRGPFASFQRRRRGQAEVHLLLTGELGALTPLYDGLPAQVEIDPARIL